ncbi:dTMP kinase [Methylophaga sp. OBS1]|jgi:dTMP kinase|uniref:dTMP kinase n=1 Tax=Methylophaga sp. OBS1 TaxID=2991933 RepID=UPI002256FA69|nr:dTMP kinase [Methylophaga sp. OBS1]MCX4191296.1 dTMP kinase [Methylophaga sp. OBS1]MCX4191758.1 dTMP kinase [Methylophaga sp. OBS1]
MNGKFISVEGIEGAGKSTQISFIRDFLEANGKTVIVSREPGGTDLGEQIRELLLAPRESGMSEDTELLLMFAARAEHLHQKIKPALERGDWVLCDRFVDATFAYQGGGRGIDRKRIQTISDWTLQGLQTDLTLLFDLPVSVGQSRVIQRQQQKDRFEQEKSAFFEKIRDCYLQRAETEPDRIKRIDASQDIEAIQAQLTTILTTLLSS